MTRFQDFARKNYQPFGERDEMWHPDIIAECNVMDAEESARREEEAKREKFDMKEVASAAEFKNLDYLRQGYVIIAAQFGGTIAKKTPMTQGEIDAMLSSMPLEQREKAKADLDGMEKRLFSKNGFKELDALNSGTTTLREKFKLLGQPFASGQTIMKVSTLKRYAEMKDQIRKERQKLVDALKAAWPEATKKEVVDSQFYDPLDYRAADELDMMFTFKTTILGFVSEEMLAEQIGEAALNAEKADMVNTLAEVKANGVALMRQTIADLVAGLAESLTPGPDGAKRKFHASSVTKIMEYLEAFEDRNLWGDAALQKEIESLKKMTKGIDVAKLSAGDRGDEALRDQVRASMEKAKKSLSALVIDASARVISLD